MDSQKHPPQGIIQRILNWADQADSIQSGSKQPLRILVRILLITVRGCHRNELALRAGALTYTILLSLVPLLAMSTSLVKGLGGGDHLRQVVYEYIDTLENNTSFPAPAIPQLQAAPETAGEPGVEPDATLTTHLREAADKLFNYVDKTDFTTLGSIGVMVMLITIIMVFDTIEKAMNTIWQVKAGRSLLRKITDYLTLLILMPIAINIGFAATTIIKNPLLLLRLKPYLPGLETIFLPVFLLLLPVLSISLALAVTYMIFPNTRVRPGPACIGAVFAGSLWFAAQNVYISLQIGVSNYNAIYGSFATLPLFLLWLYLGWIFILTGAQLAFACQSRHSHQLLPLPPTPAAQLSAAFDIIHQIFLFFYRQQPLTGAMLPEICPEHSPALLTAATEQLLAAGIIHSDNKQQHLFPSIPAADLPQGTIVKAILGFSTPATEGGQQSRQALEGAIQALPENFSFLPGEKR
jgi:membrane protein